MQLVKFIALVRDKRLVVGLKLTMLLRSAIISNGMNIYFEGSIGHKPQRIKSIGDRAVLVTSSSFIPTLHSVLNYFADIFV